MKKSGLLLSFLFFISFSLVRAQTYNMPGGTVNSCTGTFQDPGGNGNYANSANVTQTICSNNGQPLYLNFSAFNLENNFDFLTIYNGSSTASPQIGSYTGTNTPGVVVASGTCLTLVFTSDGSVVNSGWTASIGCGTPPPPPPGPYSAACNAGAPFCTGTTYTFPNNTGDPSLGGGGVFGCLGSTPNPVWYYMQLATGGNMNIGISQTTTGGVGIDVDFVLWGPFTSLATGCNSISASNIESCSYSGSATETATITGGVAGEWYILLLTNFSNQNGTITFSQTSGAATTNCNILCNITSMTGAPGACNPATNTFSVNGNIQTYAPPTSGTLTISSSCGGSTTLNPPFGTSTNYTVTNIPAGSGTCTVTATYSADPLCTYTVAVTAPASCQTCTATATNAGPYCPGQTIQLNATGGGTYSWSGPGGFTSTAQNPTRAGATTAMSGVYTVTVTNGSATCTATTSVTVNPTPVITATNTGPYCPGATIQLNGTGGGTYSWSGPGAFTSTAQNPTRPTATTAMGGTYTLTVTTNGCTATATTSVTVNPTPTVTASNAGPYCPGQTISLSATGGGTYSWSGPGAFTSTSQNPTRPGATTAMSGVYTVTVTTNGCTATATTSVTVNPAPTPTASNTGPYCPGATIALTATGGGTYSWSGPNTFTSTSATPTIAGATTAMGGVYTVTVTTNGCTATATTSVTVNPTPVVTATNTGPYCPGAAISLTATGGGSYSWSGPNAFTSTSASPTIAGATTAMSGVYTVTVTTNGCTATATTSVTVNPTPTPTATNTGPYCAGTTIQLNATGGGTYSWSGPGSFTSTVQNPTRPSSTTAMSGVYTVTVTTNGCTATATTSVTVNPAPVPTATNGGPYCPGATIALTATGGGTYSWSGPNAYTSTSATPTIASATTAMSGVYTVTVTALGCTATATTSVTVNPTPTPTATNGGPYCPGATIALTATGGGTYSWSGPNAFTSTSATPTIASATTAMGGVYTVTVTVSGCTATATTSVTVNPTPTVTVANSGPYCPGTSVQLSATGGGTYSWSGPNTFTSTLQNPTVGAATTAMSGVYTVTVTTNGCTATATTSVTVNSSLVPGLASNSPVCQGTTLNLTCSNGVSWNWSGPNGFTSTQQNPSIANVTTAASGTYSATVTDASGCTGTGTLAVVVNPLPVPTASNTGPYCAGTTISLTATGGGTYSWSGPNSFTSTSASPTIASSTTAMSGVYTVTVTTNGCTATATTSVTVNPLPVPTASNTGPYCAGSTISLTATGGGTYSWSGPSGFTSTNATPAIASSTTAMSGVYTVTVTVLGCTATATTSVTVNPLPVPTASNTGPYCEGATISLTATAGGTYSWSGPSGFTSTSATPTIPASTPAMSGVYTVTVTLGTCTATATTSVTVNPLPVPTATNTGPYCPNINTQLNATGGGTYSWSGPNGFTSTIQNPTLGPATASLSGVYTVTVTLATCTATASTTISVNASLVPGLSSNSPVCEGNTLNLICANGVNWNWTGPNGFTSTQQNPSISSVTTAASGTYSATVTDASGCSGTGTITVVVNPLPTPTASNAGPYCEGTTISLSSTGGGTYSWSGPNGFTSSTQNPTIASATSAMGGVYTVTVTTNGCTATATTSVTVNPLPVPTASNSGPYCAGSTISLTATGGGTYSWSGPNAFTSTSATPTIGSSTTAMSGVYTVTVTLTGCTATATTSVTVNPLPVPTAANTGAYCEGATIQLSASGGGTYSWSGPNSFTDSNQNPSIATSTTAMSGVYTVTVTLSGCTATATTSVTVNPIPTPTASNTGPYCLNTPVQLNATGGGTYSWSGPNSFTSAAQNPTVGPATTAMNGVYTVTVTTNGCTATATTTVTVNSSLTPALSTNSPVCQNAALDLFCANGVSWNWSGPNGFTSTQQNPSIVSATPAATGVYTITVTDANGCVGTGTISATVNALPVVTVNSAAICSTQATATLTATGALTYTWTSGVNLITPSGDVVSAAPSSTTSYTVTGTDANGCVDTSVATVTVNPLPVITVSNTGPYCVNGTIQLNATGGTTYAWTGVNSFSSASQNPTITPATVAEAGQYDVTVTDANGCTSQGSTTVVVNTALVPSLSTNSPVCENATLDLFCVNGVSWNWSGPNGFTSTQQNPSIATAAPSATGTYTVSVTDANGCVGTGTISATVNALPVVTATSDSICNGQAIATMNAGGAVTYSWSGGTSPTTGATVIATPSSTTSYTVTGTDANGCVDTAVATVTVHALPVITVSNTGPYCLNATIQLNASGGTSYAWTGPNSFTNSSQNPTIANATTSEAGQYDVTVTDANGCTAQGSTTVAINTALIPSLSSNSPVCENDVLNIFCANGLAWNWTGPNGFSDATQNPIINPAPVAASGTYTVDVTDANGCVGTGTISVVVNPLPIVTVNSAAICSTQAIAGLNATGAANYTWSSGTNPATGANVSADPSSTTSYTVTGTDVNGCVDTAVAVVTVFPLPNVTVTSTAICQSDTATLTAGGAATYAWSGGTTPGSGATVITAPMSTTTYTVTGTDANNCVATAVSTVTVNSALVIDAGLNDTICFGDNIVLNATGGPVGTTYTWSPGGSGSTVSMTASATTTYTLNAVDPNGCPGSDSVTITVPPQILLNAAGFAATCNGMCDGQLVVLASPQNGSFAQYSYVWQNGGATTPSVLNVCAGTYTVTVTDLAGCVATATATVTQPTEFAYQISNITPASCNGICDGGATLTLNGGTSPYSYSWSNGNTTNSPTNLCAGTHTVNWLDANGCSGTSTVTISEPAVITASIPSVSTICIGQSATLSANASGGNGGYVYTWTGGTTPTNAASVTASPTVTTAYSVTVTDANNCAPATATVVVMVNPPLSVTASNDVAICAGQTANLSATANGGNGTFTYTWATGTTPTAGASVSAAPGSTTTYTVTVNDACGTPAATDIVVVTVNPLPVLSITASQVNGCTPVCVDFTASGASLSNVSWTFTDGQNSTGITTPQICFTDPGLVGATILATDSNGCQSTFTNNTLVNVFAVPTAEFTFTPEVASEANPIITFTDQSTGGTITSWNWTFGTANDSSSTEQNPVFDFETAGTYSVTLLVTTNNGCTNEVTHPVTIDPEFILYVPNAFSPNEDGINDTFFPKGIGVDTDTYQLWIYDRWGNMIFSTDEWSKAWDGKVQGHDEYVLQDVYVWKIKLETWKGEKKSYTGHVTVIK